ncbi:MAG: tRNA (adenosine(37)-N6)-dimethylallyltransferase MiaA [Pseudomonadota bacterium]
MSDTPFSLHVIAGPTASGKSALALELAEKHDGVIINADSMQIYDGIPILTAQPPAEDLAQAPHEFYGHLHPNEACSAGNWREMVEPRIHEILAEGKTPLITGGSGLYINALLYGLSPIPDIPEDIREAASAKQKELGNPAFHAALKERDPIMTERLDPHNTARLIRAWEVLEFSGKSLAEWQEQPKVGPPNNWQFTVHLVMPERDILYDRCNRRFIQMLKIGALEEIKEFHARIEKGEVNKNVLLTHALGYEPLSDYINGALSKDEAIEKGQAETRRYAKRQVTWFRHQIKENDNIKSRLVET